MDRIEDNQWAVILVEELKKEFVLPIDELPVDSTEKSYFELTIENDKITSMKVDPQTTVSEKEKVDAMMSRLRSKSHGSKFKKN